MCSCDDGSALVYWRAVWQYLSKSIYITWILQYPTKPTSRNFLFWYACTHLERHTFEDTDACGPSLSSHPPLPHCPGTLPPPTATSSSELPSQTPPRRPLLPPSLHLPQWCLPVCELFSLGRPRHLVHAWPGEMEVGSRVGSGRRPSYLSRPMTDRVLTAPL